MSRIKIMLSGYFNASICKPKLFFFERLNNFFKNYDIEIVLIEKTSHKKKSGLRYYNIPINIFLEKYRKNKFPIKVSCITKTAYLIESYNTTIKLKTFAKAFGKYSGCLKKIITKEKPDLCIMWHQFNGYHLYLKELCIKSGIPYIFAEYGLLPETITFDRTGQMAESYLFSNSEEFCNLSIKENDILRANNYLKYVKYNELTSKSQTMRGTIKQVIFNLKQKKIKKVLFYAGQNDPMSGIWPPTLQNSKLHSPYFINTHDALLHLEKIAMQNNWHIIFKPHPNLTYLKFKPYNSHWVTTVSDVNIFECIEETDMTITILSQVSILALIKDKPVLLLGNSSVNKKGCAYEIENIEQVESKIKEALQNNYTNLQKNAFNSFVARLLKYYLFALSCEVEKIIERGIDETARFLIKNFD